jgi:subtilase family serine protease
MLSTIMKITLRGPVSPRISSVVALLSAAACAGVLTLTGVGTAWSQVQSAAATPASGLAILPGHMHRFAQPRFDVGEAPDSLRMGGLELIIAKTPAQQRALDALVAAQQDPKSPQYHHWLSPAEYGSRFGASDATVAALSGWLASNGFQVGTMPPGRAHLPFSGSKARVEAAFHAQIHSFSVNGERHYANVSDPMVPAALKPMIAAVRGLNDFYPKPGARPMRAMPRTLTPRSVMPAPAGRGTGTSPDTFYSGSGQYPGYVGPTDFATLYNLLPAYQQHITGAGVTVAIVAQSDIDPSVLTAFWSAFGVAGADFNLPAQQFSSMAVPTADSGVDPGRTNDGNEDEAYLDTEIVGALAPGAQLLLVRDQVASIAAQYIIDQNLAAVLNVSFGQCESAIGEAANTSINAMWQQAVTEGITVTVSAGDSGVAACTAEADIGKTNDVNSNGFAVNGLASTPYDLAVGGTDFDPTMESTYWSSSNQPGSLSSATSHIPEIVWNDSCANPVFSQELGISDVCNTTTLPGGSPNESIEITGSGAGLSSCTAASAGICTGGYPQPVWQQGLVGATATTRTIPDVSMIATRWLMCSYDTNPCDPTQAPTFAPAATGTIKVLEGTSAAAPAVAAIIAMLDQSHITSSQQDGRQGLVNPMLYTLAAAEYNNPSTETACGASQGPITSPLCVFYDTTKGSNAQPCSVAHYAAASAGSQPASTCVPETVGDMTGIMEINGSPDYAASAGFDVATGLGAINAGALINTVIASAPPTGLAASALGQTVTLTWSADAGASSGYDIYQGKAPGAVSPTPIKQNVTGTSAVISGLQFGQSYVFAISAVSSTGTSGVSSAVNVTIVPAAPTGVKVSAAGLGSLSLSWTASSGANTYNVFAGTSSGGEAKTPISTGISGVATTINNLTAGKEYFFTVAAVDAGGTSAVSAQANGSVIPASPTGLAATPGNATVSLSWSAVAGAASYDVYEGTAAGGESSVPVKTGLTSPSASIGGLQNGTIYYFDVAAVNAGGTSAISNQANATPIAPPSASSGGGGSMDWLALGLLAVLAGFNLTKKTSMRPIMRIPARSVSNPPSGHGSDTQRNA